MKRGSPGVAHDGDAGRRWGTDDGRTEGRWRALVVMSVNFPET
jgi:hypothetical protein